MSGPLHPVKELLGAMCRAALLLVIYFGPTAFVLGPAYWLMRN